MHICTGQEHLHLCRLYGAHDSLFAKPQAGKAAHRGVGRGEGKPGLPGHETSTTGDGGNGSSPGDAAPSTDAATSGAQQPEKNSPARRSDACSAGGGAGTESASKSVPPIAAPHLSNACVSGTCAALDGPACLASAAGLDVSKHPGQKPAVAYAASMTPATQPEHDQRQGRGSATALTTVPGSRQVIPAASHSETIARSGSRTQTPVELAPSSKGDAQAERAGAVPVWTQPVAESQNASGGKESVVPVGKALVCSFWLRDMPGCCKQLATLSARA